MAAAEQIGEARWCVAIPTFNNVATVGRVVRGARELSREVLVLDDGSTDGSGEAAREAGATVLRFEDNRGKGAALLALLEEAHRLGYTYAVCLDADGQHLPEDLPRFAAAIAAHPGTLV